MMNMPTVEIMINSMTNTVMCCYYGDNRATFLIVMSDQPAEHYSVLVHRNLAVLFSSQLMVATTARTQQSLCYNGGETDLSTIKRDKHMENVKGGSNMTGTDLYVNKPHCAAAVRP